MEKMHLGVSLKYVVSTQIKDGEYVSACVQVGKLPWLLQ